MEATSTILIVDDDQKIRELLETLLSLDGYHLELASNGVEALSKTVELLPDLVLLDVMMPDLDGFEVCRRLRANPDLVDVLIMMVTGLDDRESRLTGLQVGADDFISKPVHGAELRARVRTMTRLNRQRRLRAHELQAERDRTHAILEALGEAVTVTDWDGKIQYLNPATVALTGFTYEEAMGKSWRQLWENKGPDEKRNDEIVKTVRLGQTWQGEVSNRRKDGSTYDAALTVAPLFAPQDRTKPIAFVSIQRDITPLKEAERAKTKFVSNVSHELRTPLSVITLLADNLDALYERLNDNKRRQMIRDMQRHAEILNNLIGDILNISQIDSGRISTERGLVDLAQLTYEEADKLRPVAQQKAHHLMVGGANSLPVWGNDMQLRQVIRNLISNAIKYTPDGGEIKCECELDAIPFAQEQQYDIYWPTATQLSEQRWTAIRVTDNGIGIAAEHIPNLFGRFYRVNTQGNIRGTGLGLSIARDLVELHEGFITIVSVPNEGSIFTVYLPMLITQLGQNFG
jgi:PAS domain S-box-containing protein